MIVSADTRAGSGGGREEGGGGEEEEHSGESFGEWREEEDRERVLA